MNLFEDIRAKVEASGFTMSAVCERAGVSSGTPTHWSAGRTKPNQTSYDKMMRALDELIAERNNRMKAAGIV